MVSTSAPSAASSWLTPSFSKICVTVSAQCRFGDADDVFRGDLESLEDHASLLR